MHLFAVTVKVSISLSALFCRTPLTPEIREVLEVAYVSKIMAKNFRKEGQPEKERIARITGLSMYKVMD